MKVRVVHLANADQTISLFLAAQLSRLKELGYDVFSICPLGPNREEIVKLGVKPIFVPVSRSISPFKDLILFFRLCYYFRRYKFHIVHAHSAKLEFVGQFAAWFARVPIILYTNHGVLFRGIPSLKTKMFKWLAKASALVSDHIFSQSNEDIGYTTQLKVYPREKVSFLGNGVNLERFNPLNFTDDEIKKKKQTLGIPQDRKVVGIVARFVGEKGYNELFEAAKIVLQQIDAHFLCIGTKMQNERDPVDFSVIDALGMTDHFTILYSRTDMPELYSVMDMIVLPSHREGFPRSLIEGAAMRKPLIATDIPGCREAVEHGKNGLLVPLKNIPLLANALTRLLYDDKQADEMGQKGFRIARERFSEDQVVARIEEKYKELIIRKKIDVPVIS